MIDPCMMHPRTLPCGLPPLFQSSFNNELALTLLVANLQNLVDLLQLSCPCFRNWGCYPHFQWWCTQLIIDLLSSYLFSPCRRCWSRRSVRTSIKPRFYSCYHRFSDSNTCLGQPGRNIPNVLRRVFHIYKELPL